MTAGEEVGWMARDQSAGREGGRVQRVTRVRGLELPGLKRWRIRRDLTQWELAQRVDVPLQYISRVEQGKRGCNRAVAQRVAEVLEVDLRELQADPDAGAFPLHVAYLKMLLGREVGSAYSVMGEEELEKHCKKLSWEEVLEVVEARKREVAFLEEELLRQETDVDPHVGSFHEGVVGAYPDLDIRVLAAARSRERSEGGREKLTLAMREFL